MNDQTSKADELKQSNEEALTDQDLEQVAGGILTPPTKTSDPTTSSGKTQGGGFTNNSGNMADVNFGNG